MTTRIILYSDTPILAEGLKAVFLATPGYELVSVATTIPTLLETIAAQQSDVVLMDLTSEVTFVALSEMKRAVGSAKIVLWVHTIATELAFQAMGLGVRGILRKTLPTALLTKCLEKIQQGELWFEKALTDSFISAKRVTLTPREGQLVSLLSQGLKNKEIATALRISEGTVKVYLSRLFRKLEVKDRFELALYGLKNLTTGQGVLDQQAGCSPEGRSLTPARLSSIVLQRSPEKIPPAVGAFQTVRPISLRP